MNALADALLFILGIVIYGVWIHALTHYDPKTDGQVATMKKIAPPVHSLANTANIERRFNKL